MVNLKAIFVFTYFLKKIFVWLLKLRTDKKQLHFFEYMLKLILELLTFH